MAHLMEHLAETCKEHRDISVCDILAAGVDQDGVQKDLTCGCVGVNFDGTPSVVFLVKEGPAWAGRWPPCRVSWETRLGRTARRRTLGGRKEVALVGETAGVPQPGGRAGQEGLDTGHQDLRRRKA